MIVSFLSISTLLVGAVRWGVPSPQPSYPIDTTVSVRLATITTDTGAFAPGLRDFTTFTTPGLCRAAARIARSKFRTSLEAQQAADTLQIDTVGQTATAQVIRPCVAHLMTQSIKDRDLGDLFAVAVYALDDSLALTVLAKIVALDRQEETKESNWVHATESFIDNGRMQAAATLMALVDAKGSAAREAQIPMHMRMALGAMLGGTQTDTLRARVEFEHVLQLLDSGPYTERHIRIAYAAYSDIMEQIVWEHPDSVGAIAERAHQALSHYRMSADVMQSTVRHLPTLTVEQLITALTPPWYSWGQRAGHVMAPRLQADYWLLPRGRPTSDTVRPVPGKINVICNTGRGLKDASYGPLSSPRRQVASMRHWLDEFGPDNLAVTLVTPISGSWDVSSLGMYYQGDFNKVRLFHAPGEETQAWQWYIHDYKSAPITIAAQAHHLIWLPPPDGRRLNATKLQFNDFWDQDPNAIKYYEWYRQMGRTVDSISGPRPAEDAPARCVVVGRAGQIDYVSGETDLSGAGTEEALTWLFRGPGRNASGADLSHRNSP